MRRHGSGTTTGFDSTSPYRSRKICKATPKKLSNQSGRTVSRKNLAVLSSNSPNHRE